MVELPPDHGLLAETLVPPRPRVLRLLEMTKDFECDDFTAKLAAPDVRKPTACDRIPADALDSVLK